MYNTHCDAINSGDNVIIGLGDSFTQGVGAYSLETWKSIPEKPAVYNIAGQYFLEEQGANNWVRQLRDTFLPDYKVFNLGINGAGNRGAVRELYLNPLPKDLGNVIVILMATGIERFDFLKRDDATAGINWHQKWQTIWPTISDRGPISIIEKEYMQQIWSKRNDALEFLFNVRDAQNFCQANGYKFLFGSAFDSHIDQRMLESDLGDKSSYIDIADWNDYVSANGCKSFMDMINQLEGHRDSTIHGIHRRASANSMPSEYITPCAHWTIRGQFTVAKQLHKELLTRNVV